MKIATWNVNHRAVRKTIPDTLAPAIISTDADVLVFTEFVHCDTKEDRQAFYGQLRDAGYSYQLRTVTTPKENHILISSRQPIAQGDLLPPPTTIHSSVPSNFLHVKSENTGIEIIGIRVPDYSKPVYKDVAKAYWEWFTSLTDKIADRPIILTGDFNIDPDMKKYKFRHHLNDLLENGWQIASPDNGASFWANKNNAPHRLDHAFLSDQLNVKDASYISSVPDLWVCGENRFKEPDHAILMVEVS